MSKFYFPLLLSKERWRKLSIAERGAVAINIPLVCLFLSLGTHVFLRQATLQSEQKVEHVQTVLQESRTLLLDMLNAETGVRGYFNSREPEFLEPYIQGKTKLPKTLDRLKQLVQSNPSQIRRTETLDQLATQKLNILKQGLEKVQLGTVKINASGLPMLGSFEGKLVMDRFRSVLAEFEAEENRSLISNYQNLQQLRDLNILLILLSVAIGGIGAAIAANLFKSLAQELAARELMLQESNSLIRAIFSNVVDGVVKLQSGGNYDVWLRKVGINRSKLDDLTRYRISKSDSTPVSWQNSSEQDRTSVANNGTAAQWRLFSDRNFH
jgi:CHASE3 domain sensor protein